MLDLEMFSFNLKEYPIINNFSTNILFHEYSMYNTTSVESHVRIKHFRGQKRDWSRKFP